LGYHFGQNPSLTPIIRDSIGFTSDFTWHHAVNNALWTLLGFNKVLFGWPSSLALIPFAFLGLKRDLRPLAWLGAAGWLILPYFFFSYYGFEYEARYYAPALPFFAILTTCGVQKLYHWLRSLSNAMFAQVVLFSLLVLFGLHSLCYYWPSYLWPRYRDAYEQASPALHDQAQKQKINPALILIEGASPTDFNYSSGFIYNDPFLRSPIIYARYLPSLTPCLKSAFPSRNLYRARWDTTNSTWHIVRDDDMH
jgi:hypothetical protein